MELAVLVRWPSMLVQQPPFEIHSTLQGLFLLRYPTPRRAAMSLADGAPSRPLLEVVLGCDNQRSWTSVRPCAARLPFSACSHFLRLGSFFFFAS